MAGVKTWRALMSDVNPGASASRRAPSGPRRAAPRNPTLRSSPPGPVGSNVTGHVRIGPGRLGARWGAGGIHRRLLSDQEERPPRQTSHGDLGGELGEVVEVVGHVDCSRPAGVGSAPRYGLSRAQSTLSVDMSHWNVRRSLTTEEGRFSSPTRSRYSTGPTRRRRRLSWRRIRPRPPSARPRRAPCGR